jgi:dTDP-4-dehydrorhamnose 3,5-epimerase and related enzymes
VPAIWSETKIPGALRRTLSVVADPRGSFTELWRASVTGRLTESPFVQANLSRSAAGVLRGMHFHRRQDDLWILTEGRASVALVDLRGHEADGPPPLTDSFELAAGDAVFIPEMVAHGFYAIEPSTLFYLVTNEYDGSDELGFAWDDPQVGISWPQNRPILSDRDQANPSLLAVFDRTWSGSN